MTDLQQHMGSGQNGSELNANALNGSARNGSARNGITLNGSAQRAHNERAEVLIVGAGPVGLTVGINLRRYGVPCVIVEKRAREDSSSNGLMLSPASLHVFDALGVSAPMLAQARKVANANLYWEGKRLYRLPFHRMASPFNYLVMQPQPVTEAVLKAQFLRLGGRYLLHTELIALHMDGADALVQLATQAQARWERYRFVVGADGSRSTVRASLGIASVEDKPQFMHFLLGDFVVEWDGGDLRESHYFINDDGFMIVMPLKPGYCRVFFKGNGPCPQRSDLTDAWFQQVAKAVAPPALKLSAPVWLSMVGHHAKVAERFRAGNVFLAGDAAHSFSPMGGQGMNTGIQDAFNLSWKLAFAYHRLGNDALLDSYHDERHAATTEVAAGVMANTRLICREERAADGPVQRFLPSRANRQFLRHTLPLLMSGLMVRYRPGSGAPAGGWVGAMVPPATLDAQFHGLYSQNWFTLLVFNKTPLQRGATTALNVLCTRLRDVLELRLLGENESGLSSLSNASWMGRLGEMASARFELADGTLLLVRPDRYVACQCGIDDMQQVAQYLAAIAPPRQAGTTARLLSAA